MFNAAALTSRSRVTKNVTITTNQIEWNLLDELFGGTSPGIQALVNITIGAGVYIRSSDRAVPAMDLRGLPANSTINITNNGYVIGRGGDGGKGKNILIEDIPAGHICGAFADPDNGGPAMWYDGSNVNLNIDNESGAIFGGGGGGGGGSADYDNGALAGGGGGGGGAGGGAGGNGGNAFGGDAGDDGNPGGDTNLSTGGSGGAGGSSGGASAGAGGAGGNYGEAGASGGNGSCGAGDSGGSAGAAVLNSGTGSLTFTTGGVDGADVKGAF